MAGSGVLAACLKDPRIKKITTITRKPLPFKNEKITPILPENFLDYSAIEDRFKSHTRGKVVITIINSSEY